MSPSLPHWRCWHLPTQPQHPLSDRTIHLVEAVQTGLEHALALLAEVEGVFPIVSFAAQGALVTSAPVLFALDVVRELQRMRLVAPDFVGEPGALLLVVRVRFH